MKNVRRLWLPLVLLVLLLGGVWWLMHPHHGSASRSPEDPSVAAKLKDAAVIEQGHYLAVIGDCGSCHTARSGQSYAGGRMIPTPYGDIPASNLTPDPETGIGRWRFEDFWRAMHDGTGREGKLLYPAFPYTSFTKLSREDALAIFAYLRSLPPVRQVSPPLGLRFPYNIRGALTAWRAVYFQPGVYRPDPPRPEAWNRGAYLVQGLGHCNECHAARGAWGGISASAPLSGGRIPQQDWYAPDLSMQANGGLQGWSKEDVVDLLQTGQSSKGAAFGPMADVVANSTQYLSISDLQAIAEYLASLPARQAPLPAAAGLDSKSFAQRGGDIYAHQCAGCHGADGRGVPGIYPPLDGNVAVTEPTGVNATRIVLLGGFAPVTEAHPRPYSMPPYAQLLNDADVAAVVTYIRQAWSNRAPAILERDVIRYRHTPVD